MSPSTLEEAIVRSWWCPSCREGGGENSLAAVRNFTDHGGHISQGYYGSDTMFRASAPQTKRTVQKINRTVTATGGRFTDV